MTWFAGRTDVVTGAAHGIGRAIAEQLARLGARVVAVDLDERALAEVFAPGGPIVPSTAWLDKPDNPAMQVTDLRSDDVYGAVIAVNFADMTIRAAMTADFATFVPVERSDQLDDPSWLAAHSA